MPCNQYIRDTCTDSALHIDCHYRIAKSLSSSPVDNCFLSIAISLALHVANKNNNKLANNREQLKSATIANFYLRNLQQAEGDVYVNCYRCLLLTLSLYPPSLSHSPNCRPNTKRPIDRRRRFFAAAGKAGVAIKPQTETAGKTLKNLIKMGN